MNDIAEVSLIIATVLATTYWRHHTLNKLRVEMLSGLDSLRSAILGKLDAIQQDMGNPNHRPHLN